MLITELIVIQVKYIDRVQIGRFEIETWYFAPYPGQIRYLIRLETQNYINTLKYKHFRRIWQVSETLDLRVLFEVYEVGEDLQIPSGLDFLIMKCIGYDHFEMVVEGYHQYLSS